MRRNLSSFLIVAAIFSSCDKGSGSSSHDPQDEPSSVTDDESKDAGEDDGQQPGEGEGNGGDTGTPDNGAPDYAADLKNYTKIASHYIELPYGLDKKLTVPQTLPEDIIIEKSYAVARETIDGFYQIRPLSNLLGNEGIRAASGSSVIQLAEFLRAGKHVLMVRTKTALYGMDIEVVSRAPERWSGEEPASCGLGPVDCNALLKENIDRYRNPQGDMLLATGTSAQTSAPFTIGFTFKKNSSSTERYAGGKFTYTLKKNLGAPAYLNQFPTELKGDCSLRSGHLACKSSSGEKLFVGFSYYLGNPTFELLFNDRTFKMRPVYVPSGL